jgi:hypothetical protein
VAKNHPSGGGERAVHRRLFERLYRRRQELPLQSDTYQVMRTDQRRYFGHPDLVLFIQRLGNQVHNLGLGTMLIGDMGMPAGGVLTVDTPATRPDWMSISSCSCRKRAGAPPTAETAGAGSGGERR